MKAEFGQKLGVVQKRDIKFCEHCGLSTPRPYAMDAGKYFCQRNCWEEWRKVQPVKAPPFTSRVVQ